MPEPEAFSMELKREIYEYEDGSECPVLVIDPVLYNYSLAGLDDMSVTGFIPHYQAMVDEELKELEEKRRKMEQLGRTEMEEVDTE